MNSWTVLGDIKKINKNKMCFGVFITPRLFLCKENLKKFHNADVYFIPPDIECARHFKIDKLIHVKDNFYWLYAIDFCECNIDISVFKNKKVIISNNFLKKINGFDNRAKPENMLGLTVADSKNNVIGKIVDYVIMPSQISFIIKNGDKVHTIPYVDSYNYRIEHNLLYVDLPEGILELN